MAKTFRRRNNVSRKQPLYKMRGCAKGGSVGDLAYTGEPIPTVPNPFLAYTGKGGASSDSIPSNPNAADPTRPNTGPPVTGDNTIFNNASVSRGGCGSTCGLTHNGGGKHKHKHKHQNRKMKGGKGCGCGLPMFGQKGGNNLSSYPNGLVGQPWTANPSPSSTMIVGNHNYYKLNTYEPDISRRMMTEPPLKGGKRRTKRSLKKKRTQRGGTLSNFLTQDLINLGRQFQFGVGSAYNALSGYPAPVSPLPWKDQFKHV